MRYIPCWKQIGIAKDRYLELLHFCRQYPEWQMEAASLIGIQGTKMDGQPRGTKKHDPVAAAAERREQLMRKISLVDECARAIGKGEWYSAIIQNVCLGKPYTKIEVTLLPTSHRPEFFRHRREFFELLDRKTE